MNRVSRLFGGVLLVLFSLAFHPSASCAGQITLADFSPAAVVQDFQVLGNSSHQYAAPLLIGSDVFSADGDSLGSSGKFGPIIGRIGTAIGNDPSRSASSIRFIDITLGTGALRAGVFVGSGNPWSVNAKFFDASNCLLGAVLLSGTGSNSGFAGWQSDASLIRQILVTDVANIGQGIIVDDLITEVPEPASIRFLMLSAVTIVWMKRWRPKLGGLHIPPVFARSETYDTKRFSRSQEENFGLFRQQPTTSTV